MLRVWISSALLVHLALSQAIPDFIEVCHQRDPKLDKCIIHTVERMRPNLRDGIPEMGVPALEPMVLPEVVISKQSTFKAVATNVYVHGASTFEIKSLKPTVTEDDFSFELEILIPKMRFEGQYEVSGRLMVLPLNGKGPIYANATNVEGKAKLKATTVVRDGVKYGLFNDLSLKLKIPNYTVKMENLFGGDKALGDAINVALNENKRQVMRILGPLFEDVTKDIIMTTANKIAEKYPLDKLFPK